MAVEDISNGGGIGGPPVGGGISLADAANAEVVTYITLNLASITAGQTALPLAPHSGGKVKLDVIEGLAAEFGTDFNVSGTDLIWSGLGLDGILQTGDKLRIVYLTS